MSQRYLCAAFSEILDVQIWNWLHKKLSTIYEYHSKLCKGILITRAVKIQYSLLTIRFVSRYIYPTVWYAPRFPKKENKEQYSVLAHTNTVSLTWSCPDCILPSFLRLTKQLKTHEKDVVIVDCAVPPNVCLLLVLLLVSEIFSPDKENHTQ